MITFKTVKGGEFQGPFFYAIKVTILLSVTQCMIKIFCNYNSMVNLALDLKVLICIHLLEFY